MIAGWFCLLPEDKSFGSYHRQIIKALLRCLSSVVGILVDAHQRLRNLIEKKRSLAQAIGTSKSRQWTKPADTLTDKKIATCRAYLGASLLFAHKQTLTHEEA